MIDATVENILKNIAASLVRAALLIFGGWLLKKGIVTNSQWDVFVRDNEAVIVGALLSLIAVLWSAWQKRHANLKINAALAQSPTTSRAQFERKRKK